MPYMPLPPDSFLHHLELSVHGGRKRWRDRDRKRLYEWDGLHGEVEIYNDRGRHLGAADPLTGQLTKDAVKGRRVDV